jgi:hypothetical protein
VKLGRSSGSLRTLFRCTLFRSMIMLAASSRVIGHLLTNGTSISHRTQIITDGATRKLEDLILTTIPRSRSYVQLRNHEARETAESDASEGRRT